MVPAHRKILRPFCVKPFFLQFFLSQRVQNEVLRAYKGYIEFRENFFADIEGRKGDSSLGPVASAFRVCRRGEYHSGIPPQFLHIHLLVVRKGKIIHINFFEMQEAVQFFGGNGEGYYVRRNCLHLINDALFIRFETADHGDYKYSGTIEAYPLSPPHVSSSFSRI